MRIELVTIGTELLLGLTVDTNAAEMGQMCAEYGIRLVRHTTVDDDPEHIRDAVAEALARTGFVITTGGLGPTRDDISREVIAELLEMPLHFDESVWAGLQARYRTLGRDLPETNRPQAMVPTGATILPNQWGTAPGLWLQHARGTVAMLPGVPNEMRRMLRTQVLPRIDGRTSDGRQLVTRSRTVRTAAISESALAGLLVGLEETLAPLTLAYLPQGAGVDLRITAWEYDPVEADALLAAGVERLREKVGDAIYGEGNDDLAGHVLELLRARGLRLALAESCTGGMLGGQLTANPGSSDVFLGGVVVYANSAKVELADVPAMVLDQFGAVSAEVAEQLALGVATKLGADVGLSITGVAGPGGGSVRKPVGTVFLGFAVAGVCDSIRVGLPGSRQEVRERAVTAALMGLRKRLLNS